MQLPKKFNNRENQMVYIGRSTAVVGLIFAIIGDETHVLVTRRSKLMPSEPQKLCLPCGFLDWDETRHEAMMREVYEETSFYMPDSEEYLVYNNDKRSFISLDEPYEGDQNISEIFISVYNFTDEPDAFPSDVENFYCDEVDKVQWMEYRDFIDFQHHFNWAFDHNNKIIKGWEHWNNLPYNKK